MKQLKVELQHCYGIKSLKEQFDFSNASACAIYAPNGAMKSSLAKTFQDIADSKASGDRIFPDRVCKRAVVDDEGVEVPPECILVVRPYDEVFGHTERTSTLLVNAALREEYERLHLDKGTSGLTLSKASGIQNVFVRDWKKAFFDDPMKRIASVPFMRNLIEYTKGEADPDYLSLTSLLHWKKDTASLTEGVRRCRCASDPARCAHDTRKHSPELIHVRADPRYVR